MQRYIIRRIGEAVLALLALSIIIFLMVRLTGDPALLMLPPDAGKEALEDLRHSMGVDKPLVVQYGLFIRDYSTGSFGDSLRSKSPVSELIKDRLPNSMKLVGAAALIVILISIPLGVLSAVYKGTWIDTACTGIAVLGQAIPVFWLEYNMVYLFAVKLRWLPALGYESISDGIVPWLRSIAMPSICVGVIAAALPARITRSTMLEILKDDYVRTARAKGLSMKIVVNKHAMKNAMIPILTIASVQFGYLLSGSVIIEQIFGLPGIGWFFLQGLLDRDYPVVQIMALFMVCVFVFVNLITDIAYAYLDPRIKYNMEQ